MGEIEEEYLHYSAPFKVQRKRERVRRIEVEREGYVTSKQYLYKCWKKVTKEEGRRYITHYSESKKKIDLCWIPVTRRQGFRKTEVINSNSQAEPHPKLRHLRLAK